MNKPENRVDKIVSDLLRGRRLRLRGGDAEEKAAITAAARRARMSSCSRRARRQATRFTGSLGRRLGSRAGSEATKKHD